MDMNQKGFTNIILIAIVVIIAIGFVGYSYFILKPKLVLQNTESSNNNQKRISPLPSAQAPSTKISEENKPPSVIKPKTNIPLLGNTSSMSIISTINNDDTKVFDIHAYADTGTGKELHTGIVKNLNPENFDSIEEQIPNSQLWNSTHWQLNLDTDYTYRIEIIGKADGYFVLKLKDIYDKSPMIIYPATALTATSLQDLPKKLTKVTSLFRAKMIIPRHFTEPPVLSADTYGDGTYETQLQGAICKDKCL